MSSIDEAVDGKTEKQPGITAAGQFDVEHADATLIDAVAEKSSLRKLDIYFLPFLSLMYFFNAVDRGNLGNAKTDHIDRDLHFKGNEYSLLILLFYIPFGLLDLPLNLMTKKFSAKLILPCLMFFWGAVALLQVATKNFGGLLALRLLMGAAEAGFFAGVVFYFTLFYSRGELGFRIAIFFGSALLAAAFSGLISYGVFRIDNPHLQGWQVLFLIEGALTIIVAVVAFFWLPATPATAWFLNDAEKTARLARARRDGTFEVGSHFNMKECFQTWSDWKFPLWCITCFAYPVAFATTSNFLPQVVARLGHDTVTTNLLTVPPNACGFIVLLCVAKSSDYFRERCFHIVFALCTSLVGMVILIAVDTAHYKAVSYFAMFLMASGAYIPSCLVHSWHNNNNLNESSRAATTGLLVGLGNFAGIMSAATFRTEYAPAYKPMFITTVCCNIVAISGALSLGLWMKRENRRRNRLQGVNLEAKDINTSDLPDGENSPGWRYFT